MFRVDLILNRFIEDNGIQEGVRLLEMKENWNKLFAKPLSLHMFPSVLSEGNLIINVDSNIWLQELNFYKDEIIKKLHPYGVKNVRFRLGKILKQTKSRFKSQKIKDFSLPPEELSYIEEILSFVSDSELRKKIRSVIVKSIVIQKTGMLIFLSFINLLLVERVCYLC